MARIFDWIGRLAWPVGPGALRLWLAYLVFVHHMSSFAVGSAAVYIFFGLSGYWLQTMWEARYRKANTPYITYLLSRFWRLAPVMWVISLMMFGVYSLLGTPWTEIAPDPTHLAFSTVFLLGYGSLEYLPLTPAWSLDVEWQFYMLVPILALLVKRWPMIVLVLALGVSAWAGLNVEAVVLPRYIFFFIAGMAVAVKGWQPRAAQARAAAALFVLVLVAVTISPWRDILWGGADRGPLFVYNVPFNALLATILLPFAFRTVHQPSDVTDRAMGDLSFPIYLMHWCATMWFYSIVAPFHVRAAAAAFGLVSVTILSVALWYFMDRPLNRWRAKWVAGRMKHPVSRERAAAEPSAP